MRNNGPFSIANDGARMQFVGRSFHGAQLQTVFQKLYIQSTTYMRCKYFGADLKMMQSSRWPLSQSAFPLVGVYARLCYIFTHVTLPFLCLQKKEETYSISDGGAAKLWNAPTPAWNISVASRYMRGICWRSSHTGTLPEPVRRPLISPFDSCRLSIQRTILDASAHKKAVHVRRQQ